jgi:hypothetical protein
MKKLIGSDSQGGGVLGGYTFSPSTNKVTITGLSFNLTLNQILLITDMSSTSGTSIIYNFANPVMNGTILNNVITLDYNCSALFATDILQIYVDVPDTAPIDTASAVDSYTHVLLERICDLLEPMATQDQQNRQRVSIDAIVPNVVIGSGTVTTVSTVTTCSTLSTISNAVPIGNVATWGPTPGGNIEWQMIDWARQAYESGIRSQLTFGN